MFTRLGLRGAGAIGLLDEAPEVRVGDILFCISISLSMSSSMIAMITTAITKGDQEGSGETSTSYTIGWSNNQFNNLHFRRSLEINKQNATCCKRHEAFECRVFLKRRLLK